MPYYRSVGDVPRKRHTQFRQPDGGLYAEELIGTEGFSQESSLLYHRHLPTAIVAAETVVDPRQLEPLVANDPLLPRHFRTDALPAGGDAVAGAGGPGGQRRRDHLDRRRHRGQRALPQRHR